MGNRLGSPRKRKQPPATAASVVALEAPASPVLTSVDVNLNEAHRPTSPSLGKINGGSTEPTPEEPDATPRTPRSQQHPWQLVPTALHVTTAFAQPVKEEQECQRQRHERLALVNGDPELFFAVHSMQNYDCELTLEDVSLIYSNALLLKARGDMMAATDQLRIVAASGSWLAVDAQVHLAQCLMLQDPTLETHGSEIERLLIECTSGKNAKMLEAELKRMATELLVHVLMARGSFREAYEMLKPLAASLTAPPSVDLLFTLASCEHQLTDPLSSSNHQRDERLRSIVSAPSDFQSSAFRAPMIASPLAVIRTEAEAVLTDPSFP